MTRKNILKLQLVGMAKVTFYNRVCVIKIEKKNAPRKFMLVIRYTCRKFLPKIKWKQNFVYIVLVDRILDFKITYM